MGNGKRPRKQVRSRSPIPRKKRRANRSKPRSYKGFMESLTGHQLTDTPISPSWPVGGLYIWSPNLAANLDLYTLHFFEAGKEEGEFDRLRIIRPRFHPDQVRDDTMLWTSLRRHERFALSYLTRVSLIMPAFSKMILELLPAEPDHLARPADLYTQAVGLGIV